MKWQEDRDLGYRSAESAFNKVLKKYENESPERILEELVVKNDEIYLEFMRDDGPPSYSHYQVMKFKLLLYDYKGIPACQICGWSYVEGKKYTEVRGNCQPCRKEYNKEMKQNSVCNDPDCKCKKFERISKERVSSKK